MEKIFQDCECGGYVFNWSDCYEYSCKDCGKTIEFEEIEENTNNKLNNALQEC